MYFQKIRVIYTYFGSTKAQERLAQLARAFARRRSSVRLRYAPHTLYTYGRLAQLVRASDNDEVGGSSPPLPTDKSSGFLFLIAFASVFAKFIVFRALAQLARALRWQRRGHRFKSDILHHRLLITTIKTTCITGGFWFWFR